jgi:hypothetical protein
MINKYLQHNYVFDPLHTYNFEKYDLSGISIYYGSAYGSIKPIEDDKNKKVLFVIDQPNGFYSMDKYYDFFNSYFDLILTIDKYTSNYYNNKFNTNKFIYTFFPIELENLVLDSTYSSKTLPIFYTGHLSMGIPFPLLTTISNTLKKYIEPNTLNYLNSLYSQGSIDSYYNKMRILENTKIAIVHCCHPDFTKTSDFNEHFLNNKVNSYLVWHDDKEDVNHYFPQIKSRIFEASIMRCIMLVYKDKYNIIEDYFEEASDFLYFENEIQLNELIEKILTNYDSYKYIAENAFNKTFNNYTTKNLVDNINRSLKN